MKRIPLLTLILIVPALYAQAACTAGHGICLSWTLSTTPGITSQVVYRGTTPGGENFITPLATIPNGTATNSLDTTGAGGLTYYYVVEACIGTICSVPSNEATAVFPTVPVPQAGLSASPQ